ncbi:hypothetical protein [Microbaculum marinum]|uniref:Uncharacterized protein n=1 Tax=Microbaculum marinum TaxID=1764581 RepID=A0AAW9RQP2_9HYPH
MSKTTKKATTAKRTSRKARKPRQSRTNRTANQKAEAQAGSRGNNGGGRKERFTPEQVVEALRQSGGIQAGAAQLLKCSRSTVTDYLHRYPEIAERLPDIGEETLDLAELGLLNEIKSQNLTAIIFFLKTRGKHRGYVQRVENTGPDGGPQQHEHTNLPDLSSATTDELRKQVEELTRAAEALADA